MKRSHCLLIAALGLAACQTAHNAAVSTFRVIDAPAVYVRNKLDLDENDTERQPATTTTTTGTTTVAANAPHNTTVSRQPFSQSASSSQTTIVHPETVVQQQQREVVMNERTSIPTPTPTVKPKPTPRLTTTTKTETRSKESSPNPSPQVAAADKANLPYAKPVPGKPGYVFSPFDPNDGYVDVTGFAPGSKVKDPYSGKIFLVP